MALSFNPDSWDFYRVSFLTPISCQKEVRIAENHNIPNFCITEFQTHCPVIANLWWGPSGPCSCWTIKTDLWRYIAITVRFFFFFFLAVHSKASYKSSEAVNQTWLFTSEQLSHPLLKLKHNSAATGIPSSTWPRRAAAGTRSGCTRLGHSFPSTTFQQSQKSTTFHLPRTAPWRGYEPHKPSSHNNKAT